jgi:hypothetical protein
MGRIGNGRGHDGAPRLMSPARRTMYMVRRDGARRRRRARRGAATLLLRRWRHLSSVMYYIAARSLCAGEALLWPLPDPGR